VAILLPAEEAKVWGTTDQVGIAENISLGNLGSLGLLVEKDFACLDRSERDSVDAFPNPHKGTVC
jgi:hypothetical protein